MSMDLETALAEYRTKGANTSPENKALIKKASEGFISRLENGEIINKMDLELLTEFVYTNGKRFNLELYYEIEILKRTNEKLKKKIDKLKKQIDELEGD